MVVVEDLHDLGLLDAVHALRALGMVDEQHAPRRGVDEVRARHEADRSPGAVQRDGRAVVHGLDLLGDVRHEVVEADGQRVALDEGVDGL